MAELFDQLHMTGQTLWQLKFRPVFPNGNRKYNQDASSGSEPHPVAVVVEEAQASLAQELHAAAGHRRSVTARRNAQQVAVTDHAGFSHPDISRQLGVRAQECILAMHWKKMLRLDQLHHLFQFFPAQIETPLLELLFLH